MRRCLISLLYSNYLKSERAESLIASDRERKDKIKRTRMRLSYGLRASFCSLQSLQEKKVRKPIMMVVFLYRAFSVFHHFNVIVFWFVSISYFAASGVSILF